MSDTDSAAIAAILVEIGKHQVVIDKNSREVERIGPIMDKTYDLLAGEPNLDPYGNPTGERGHGLVDAVEDLKLGQKNHSLSTKEMWQIAAAVGVPIATVLSAVIVVFGGRL